MKLSKLQDSYCGKTTHPQEHTAQLFQATTWRISGDSMSPHTMSPCPVKRYRIKGKNYDGSRSKSSFLFIIP